jgi:hypothetical protein
MVTRAPFLKTRYSGYHHRQVPQEDAALTHVGPETPCGEANRQAPIASRLYRPQLRLDAVLKISQAHRVRNSIRMRCSLPSQLSKFACEAGGW